MLEFVSSVLTSSSFIPDGHCYLWKPGLIWLHIISDSLSAIAYYSIPLMLVRFVQKRRDLPYAKVLLLFSAFTIACGTTHIMDVWTLWHPSYWLFGFLKALSAFISVCTAITLIPIIPQALILPSLEQLEATNYQLLAEVLERRSIEEKLRSSKQMLQLVIDNIPQFIFWKDINSVYLGCNRSFAHAAGLDNSLEIVGKTDENLSWSSEAADRFREYDDRVIATDIPQYHIIESLLSADGKQNWKDINKIPLHNIKGNVVGLLSTVEDITERKQVETVLLHLNEELEIRVLERTVALSASNQQLAAEIAERQAAETALRRSEERYRSLVEATSQIIWDTSAEGEFITEQPSWSAFTGQTIDEFRGWGWLNAIHPSDRSHTAQAWSQSITNGILYEVEHRLRRDDGEYKYMSVRAVPVWDNDSNIREWVGVYTDITERKRSEEALFSSLATNRALLNAIPDLMFRLSRDGILVNYKVPKESEILFQAREYLGKNIIEALPKDIASTVLQLIEKALQTGELQVYEFQLPQSNNITYWEARLVLSESNEVMAIVRDITQRKLIEEDTSNALKQEKELSELKSRFITMTSHEFRTPLTTILLSAELLKDYGQNWSEEKKVEHLQRIQVSGEQITNLLNDVLLLGKAEAGKLECQASPLNLSKFCNDLVEEIQLGSGSKHMIVFVEEGECTTTCIDEKLLRPILSNLLSNAIKYSPTSSIIQVTVACQKEEVIFQVEDSGIGIPPEDLQRLFEPFHRAKNVGTIPGTGLGMAIVKKSVDSHGGQITVKSEVGVGTVFTVTLPLHFSSDVTHPLN